VALVCIIAYLVIFLRVRARDSARADAIREAAIARMVEREKQAAGDNGFDDLSNILKHDSRPEDCAPYNALKDYWHQDLEEVSRRLRENPQKTRQNVEKFLAVLPRLERAFVERRYFIIPVQPDLGLQTPAPNYVQLRNAVISLVVLGRYCELQGRPREAARYYLDGISVGSKLSRQGPLITAMIAVSLMHLGTEPFIHMMAKQHPDEKTCRELLARMRNLPISPNGFVEVMDEEYALVLQTFDLMLSGKVTGRGGNFPVNSLPTLPAFMVRREIIQYQNWYLAWRPYFEQLKDPAQDGLTVEKETRRFRRQLCFFATVLIPNISRAMAQYRFALTRLSALEVMLALEIFRADRGGKYPADLTQLVPQYLPRLPADYMNSQRTFFYQCRGDEYTLVSRSPDYQVINRGNEVSFNPPRL